jgi:hypothetical protein
MAYVTDPSIGYSQMLGITASTVVKTGAGLVAKVCVNASPTGSGGVYDSASIGGATAANQICAFPLTGTAVIDLRWGVTNGITVLVAGGSPNIAIAYS